MRYAVGVVVLILVGVAGYVRWAFKDWENKGGL